MQHAAAHRLEQLWCRHVACTTTDDPACFMSARWGHTDNTDTILLILSIKADNLKASVSATQSFPITSVEHAIKTKLRPGSQVPASLVKNPIPMRHIPSSDTGSTTAHIMQRGALPTNYSSRISAGRAPCGRLLLRIIGLPSCRLLCFLRLRFLQLCLRRLGLYLLCRAAAQRV